jgi:hypothetical protein
MFKVLGIITFCFIVILILSIMLAVLVTVLNYVIDSVNSKLTKEDEDDII